MRFAETRLGGEELVAGRRVLVLLECGPDAVLLGGGADAGGEFALDVGVGVGDGDELVFYKGELLGGGLKEDVDGPLPPARETGVIH